METTTTREVSGREAALATETLLLFLTQHDVQTAEVYRGLGAVVSAVKEVLDK